MKLRKHKPPLRRHQFSLVSHYILITQKQLFQWGIILTIIGLLIYSIQSNLFRLKSISCTVIPHSQPCSEPVMAELNKLTGKLIFFLNFEPVKQKLLTADPQISQVNSTYQFPSQLTISLEYNPTAYALKVATDSAALIADTNGKIISLSPSPPKDIPTIIAVQVNQLSVGQVITDPDLQFALTLAQVLQKNYLSFTYLQIIDINTIEAIISEDQPVLFSPLQDVEKSVTSLQLILSKATIPPGKHVIDLRFAKPIIKY